MNKNKRTYYGKIFIANSVKEDFLDYVINDFQKYDITEVDDGVIISGNNFCFNKDNLEWNCFIQDDHVIYFEVGNTSWIKKPLLNYIDDLGTRCIIAEQVDYLNKINLELVKFENAFFSKASKRLIEIEETNS